MKKIICLLMLCALTCAASAQNFTAPKKQRAEVVDSTTTYTYTMPDKTYKVYRSKNGAYYVWKVSKKTGKPYRYYLPKEVQIQMGRKYDNK